MKLTSILFTCLYFSTLDTHAQTVSDIDGNTYQTIVIGSQTWMKENLKTTHFSNGDAIPTTSLATQNDSTIIFQWTYNNDTTYLNTYGRLYSWYTAIDNRNLCPSGWHLPSDTEITILSNFVGGDNIAGNKLKESGTTHWLATTSDVDNASGFTALPAGFKGNSNVFVNINTSASFWTSTSFGSSAFPRGNVYNLQSGDSLLHYGVAVSNCGMSVRCLKNMASGINKSSLKHKINIYPNPASNQLTIELNDTENCQLFVYDILGTIVTQKQLFNKTNTIEIASLSKGAYLVEVAVDDEVMRQMFVKE